MKKIQSIIAYLENHFDSEINSHQIEHISNYSYRNTQRVFKKNFGENITDFQRRFRLEKAYKRIIYTEESITNIAISVGYGSLQSFSKAFAKQFKISPVKARVEKEAIFKKFIINTSSDIKVEKLYKEKQIVYYTSIKSHNYNNDEINRVWRNIDQKNQDISPYESYGIIVDQPLITEHKNCIYKFGLDKVSKQNSGFIKVEIFGGYYLKFTHFGNYTNIEETYQSFYKHWLFNTYLELGDSPVIEHYTNSYKESQSNESFVTDIYFPLK